MAYPYSRSHDSHGNDASLLDADERPLPRYQERRCRKFSTFFSALVLLGIATVIIVLVSVRGSDGEAKSPDSNETPKARECPQTIAPEKRVVSFWQSEVAGCEKIPDGVTHVVFGFALVADGVVVPTFQNTDEHIKECVQQLKQRCIVTMGSIGGSTNNRNLSQVTDYDAFAASVVTLVETFGFDGIDLDDETVGEEFSEERAVGMARSTRQALDRMGGPHRPLSYCSYFMEAVPSFCSDPVHVDYSRCLAQGVLRYVDWINVMAYNVHQDPSEAAKIYEAAINTTFVEWSKQLRGDFSRAAIGFCIGQSCAFGPGPSQQVIDSWAAYGKRTGAGGGVMIYASSIEVQEDFPVTRTVV